MNQNAKRKSYKNHINLLDHQFMPAYGHACKLWSYYNQIMNMKKENQQRMKLNNGNQIPMLGAGTLRLTEKEQCKEMIYEAIKAGYRMFDTASAYDNEEEIGRGIKKAIDEGLIKREELFLITKLWIQDEGKGKTRKAVRKSMGCLGTDYLDLYLVHQPYGDYYGAWHEMEDLYREGVLKNIGVSNFSKAKLVDLICNNKIIPAVNQIEVHPFFHHEELLQVMKEYEVAPIAWGPLSEGQRDIFHIGLLEEIGNKYGKSVAQIVLRWHIQKGVSVIPKTTQKDHLLENIDIWDFELSKEDMLQMPKLDIGYSEIINHNSACTAKWLNQWKIHE